MPLKINPPLDESWYNNNAIDTKPTASNGLIHFLNDSRSNRITASANSIIRNSGKKYCMLERLSIDYIKEFIIEIKSPIANLTIFTRGSGYTPNNKTKNAIGRTVASSLGLISSNFSYTLFKGPRNTL